ncbi:hypothetical protein THAOC_25174 [Thalassiosira oceanica]|uniref:Uncharacterized protein n=1 Tax=Thalassiosira oceanica TaxID=159749 RepID=K0RPV3_THAOC|nr:hypothetical protein THAOC_25174 [Thalassiosira oceanica]|eukprot:EJK55125.1 hypothetical protein THAOC_25174 [Thalassiosira oceanica]
MSFWYEFRMWIAKALVKQSGRQSFSRRAGDEAGGERGKHLASSIYKYLARFQKSATRPSRGASPLAAATEISAPPIFNRFFHTRTKVEGRGCGSGCGDKDGKVASSKAKQRRGPRRADEPQTLLSPRPPKKENGKGGRPATPRGGRPLLEPKPLPPRRQRRTAGGPQRPPR